MVQPPDYPRFLDFDSDEFYRKNRPTWRKLPTPREWSQMFVDHINQELLRRPRDSPLEEFTVKFDYTSTRYIRSSVDSWVRYVASTKAAMLGLIFNEGYDPCQFPSYGPVEQGFVMSRYAFPFSELVGSSIEVLNLDGCDVGRPATELPPRLDSIKELHMHGFHGSEEQIQRLVSSCLNLESLTVDEGFDLGKFKIVSPTLNHFTFIRSEDDDEAAVEICAPRLESVKYCFGCGGMFAITDASSLVSAEVAFRGRSWRSFSCWSNALSFLGGIERLTIQNMWTWFLGEPTAKISSREKEPQGGSHAKNEHFEETLGEIKLGEAVFSETFAFHNLKRLKLLTGYLSDDVLGLEILLNKCPQLEKLTLSYEYQSPLDDQLGNEIADRPVALHMPRLRQVKMKDYRGTKNELYVAGLLKKCGQVLQDIVASPPKESGRSGPTVVL